MWQRSARSNRWQREGIIALGAAIALLLAACGGAANVPPTAEAVAPSQMAASPTDTEEDSDEVIEEVVAPLESATNTEAEETSVELPTPTAHPTALPIPVFDPATTQLGIEAVVTGLSLPVFATHANDGSNRLFIVEKAGTIRILQDGALLTTPFLDITDRVGSSANEQGLLGLAFAPDYGESGHFWVNFTDRQGDTVIARFTVTEDPDTADPNSYHPVLQLDQPAPNHNGGMIAFGDDGMLWIGTGDGGAAGDRFNNGQNPNTLLGKMLRLDVTSDPEGDYIIPADNPWVNADWNGQTVRDEIWAVGLRNPWRYSFDRVTGDLWVADVGQNIWEEVNYTPAQSLTGTDGGFNFGWPIMEGTHCYATQNCDQTGLLLPVAEYDHSGHCSITGGYVYRGAAYPQLYGVYLYGDYCSGRVWALSPDGNGGWQNPVAFDSSFVLSSFAEDEAGELYLLDYNGSLNRLVVAGQ